MAKRPTPKKRRPKSRTRVQRSTYLMTESRRLRALSNSPYAGPAAPKKRGEKAVEKITRIKA
ncbi:MAG: hypothetical protein G01um101425_831 [Candidatus Peregrinibacteria bacterium Gr01-1014_25]|nr:MAG: hypothetical protein G01um101425_831 [Candidatus Peregrinibacteria bacterium Gr01-1014_25]